MKTSPEQRRQILDGLRNIPSSIGEKTRIPQIGRKSTPFFLQNAMRNLGSDYAERYL